MARLASRLLRPARGALLGRNLLALLLCSAWLVLGSAPAKELEPTARLRGPFPLVDHHGAQRTEADFRGQFLLVYFGYTHCPDICPLALQAMGDTIDRLDAEGERVQPIFITVDPARDTPEIMRAYVAAIHPRLIGLTGSEENIRAVTRAYRVQRRKVRLEPGDPLDYTVDHGSLIHILDPDGELLAQLPPTIDVDELTEQLRRYLAAKPAATAPAAGRPVDGAEPR